MKDHDQYWIQLIRDGDEQAFKELFNHYYLVLTRFAWRFLGSKAIAEELVQDLFADIWEKKAQLHYTGSLRSYLYKVIKGKCINYIKHEIVRGKYDVQWMTQWETNIMEFEDQESDQEIQLVKEALHKAIDELPPRSQMVFKLHRYDGLTYPEIAEVMNVSLKTVESQMTRALKLLRNCLIYNPH